MSRMDVHGTVADGFEQVREEFAAVVAEQDGQVGSQLTATASRPPGTPSHDALTSGYTAGMLGAGAFYLTVVLAAVLLLRPHPVTRSAEPLGSTPG